MPSKSPAQARLMRAVAHGWKKPGGGGPTRAVAREFVNADRSKKVQSYQFGGPTGPSMYRGIQGGQKPMMGGRDPRAMPPQMTTNGPGSPPRGGAPQMNMRMPTQKPMMGGRDPRAFPGTTQPGRPMMGGRPRGGALSQFAQQNNMSRGMQPPPGRMMTPPMNQYPGGGNPNLGGRNPMMRQMNQMRRGPTSYLR